MPTHRKPAAKASKKRKRGRTKPGRRAATGGRSEQRVTRRRRSAVPIEAADTLGVNQVDEGDTVELLYERELRPETSPFLSGGDLDADWQRAYSTGEEGVGGSVATPDQDVVDEIGRAFGVEQPADAEVHTAREIFEARRRLYWHIMRKTESEEQP